jgi:serine/threonine-protein phosphatase 5
MKMENYGLALIDANESINIDPNYPKAYYRKADAYIAMNKYKESLDSLKKVNYSIIAKVSIRI